MGTPLATAPYVPGGDRRHRVGRLRSFYGNFGVLVRAWTYIRSLGAEGLREVSEMAVLNGK